MSNNESDRPGSPRLEALRAQVRAFVAERQRMESEDVSGPNAHDTGQQTAVRATGNSVFSQGMPEASNSQNSSQPGRQPQGGPPALPPTILPCRDNPTHQADTFPPIPTPTGSVVPVPVSEQQPAINFLRPEPAEAGRRDERPQVLIPGGIVSITESAENLFRAIAPSKQMFYRVGAVVEVVNEGEGYTVNRLMPAAAQSRFEKYVRFCKNKQLKTTGQYMPELTTINEEYARKYLHAEACRTYLPPLNGMLHCPLLIERDGRLHRLTHGYDETTGLFVTSRQEPETVTLADAVEYLTTLLHDFDFVTPGDRSRAIASLLTPALKLGGLIKGRVPVDVAEANASQSGKTYRQRMIAALYNQKLAVAAQKASGSPGGMEETFNDHLIKGRVFIQFDNVRGKLNSPFLESYMTADGMFSARIPYAAPVDIDPSKFIVFISSNGFEATKDLANRASIIRIKRRDNYHYRTYQGKDMLQMMFELHPVLIGCVFAVVQEWYRHGKPRTTEMRHDFREWCQSLDWIVQNIFHEAPLMEGHEEAKQRASDPRQTWLRSVAIKLQEEHRFDQAISASAIVELCVENTIEIPGLTAEKQNADEGQKQVGRILGKLFGDNNELTIDNFRVVRTERRSLSSAGHDQKLKTYTFSVIGGSNSTQPPPPAPNITATPPTLATGEYQTASVPDSSPSDQPEPSQEPSDDLPRPPIVVSRPDNAPGATGSDSELTREEQARQENLDALVRGIDERTRDLAARRKPSNAKQ